MASHRHNGFALLIVLLALSFLSLLGTQIIAVGRSDMQATDNLKQDAVLEAAANGAVANVVFRMLAARNPDFQADGEVREVRVGSTTVLVRVRNESDFVNLNTASAALLGALAIESGGESSLAVRLAPAILDWRAPGSNSWRRAKAPDYQAASLAHGPPEAPFRSVDELADVLGMTPALFRRMAPHLTVVTNIDPELSTRDPVVARALSDATNAPNDSEGSQQMAKRMLRQTLALTTATRVADGAETVGQTAERILRVSAIAIGKGSAQYAVIAVVSPDFESASPRVKILSHERRVGPELGQGPDGCRSPIEASPGPSVDETFRRTCDSGDPNQSSGR